MDFTSCRHNNFYSILSNYIKLNFRTKQVTFREVEHVMLNLVYRSICFVFTTCIQGYVFFLLFIHISFRILLRSLFWMKALQVLFLRFAFCRCIVNI